MPDGIPLAILPEDEGQWYLDVASDHGHLMHKVSSSSWVGEESEHPTTGGVMAVGARSPWI